MDEMMEMWTQAANQGLVEAQFNLGAMFEDGRGVPQSYMEALKWYH